MPDPATVLETAANISQIGSLTISAGSVFAESKDRRGQPSIELAVEQIKETFSALVEFSQYFNDTEESRQAWYRLYNDFLELNSKFESSLKRRGFVLFNFGKPSLEKITEEMGQLRLRVHAVSCNAQASYYRVAKIRDTEMIDKLDASIVELFERNPQQDIDEFINEVAYPIACPVLKDDALKIYLVMLRKKLIDEHGPSASYPPAFSASILRASHSIRKSPSRTSINAGTSTPRPANSGQSSTSQNIPMRRMKLKSMMKGVFRN